MTTLTSEYGALKAIGFGDDKLGKAMAGSLNEVVRAAMEVGQKIPAAMAPLIETFVRGGNLSDDLARKLLGLPEQASVPWQQMKDIAEEFGITEGALGTKFRDAQLIEGAESLSAKWKILVDNGADVGAVIEGFTPKAQDFLTNALKWGTEIPASMKPMLESMLGAGRLTDQNGLKLKDLSGVKFSVDLKDQFEILIGKLDAFINRLTSGVPNALSELAQARVPDIVVRGRVEWSNTSDRLDQNGMTDAERAYRGLPPMDDQGFATGSFGLKRFDARGAWTKLHGEEEVLTRAQSEGVATMVAKALQGAMASSSQGPEGWVMMVDDEVLGRVVARSRAAQEGFGRGIALNTHGLGTAVRQATQ
ncbi:MAG: hypothetical protein ABIW19_08380 [Vicinamibacterales bacterium]